MAHTLIAQLIVLFFAERHIRNIVVLNCWSRHENVKLMGYLSQQNFQVNIIQEVDVIHAVYLIRNKSNNAPIGVAMDYECPRNYEIIEECSHQEVFLDGYKWLIYSTNRDTGIYNQFRHINLQVSTDLTFANLTTATSRNTSINPMYDIYNNGYHVGGKLNVTFDRYFVDNNGVGVMTKSNIALKPKYDNRNNLSDVTFRAVAIVQRLPLNTPYNELMAFLLGDNDTNVDTYPRHGFHVHLMLQDVYHFKMIWRFERRWTIKASRGAVIEMMLFNVVDFGVTSFRLTYRRALYIQPVFEFGKFEAVVVFRTQTNEGQINNILLKPFKRDVWFSMAICILIISIVLKFIYLWEVQVSGLGFIPSWMLTFISAMGAFCQQGSAIVPHTISGRIIHLMVFLTGVILYNYYTSVVVSSLIGSPVKSSIKTLRALADSKLLLGFERIPYTENYLNETDDKETQYLVKKKVTPYINAPHLWLQPYEGMSLVRNSTYAYSCDILSIAPIISTMFDPYEICVMNRMRFRQVDPEGMALRIKSPLLEISRVKLAKMHEVGILDRLKQRWMIPRLECQANNKVLSVGLEYMSSLFSFLGCAMALSLVTFLIEVYTFRFRRSNQAQELITTYLE